MTDPNCVLFKIIMFCHPSYGEETMNFSSLVFFRAIKALRGSGGQILVEYGLVLLLIAIVVLLLVKGIGLGTNNMYSKVNSSVTSAMQ